MKKNVLFIYRGQVLKSEFLIEYEKHSGQNCVLLVEKGTSYNTISLLIKRKGLNVTLMTHENLLEDKINMKFSSVVMNPPYKGGLHIDIFNKAFELLEDGGTIISIQPATPFLNSNTPKPNSKDIKIRKIIQDYVSELEMVNGNLLFNARLFVPLSIIRITKVLDISKNITVIYNHIDNVDNTIHVYQSYEDIYVHGNELVLNIKNKIFNKKTISLNDKSSKKIITSPYWVTLSAVVGNPSKNGKLNPDFYCLVPKDYENNYESLIVQNYSDLPGRPNGRDKRGIAVNTNEEAINLIKTMMTKTYRFALSLSKIGINLWGGNMLDTVPYLDFSTEWTDEMLSEYFEFTESEINFINNYIGNWYEQDFI
jgi:hypothetical protein